MNKISQSPKKVTPKVLRIWLWMKIWIHIVCGVCTLSFLFPFYDRQKKSEKIQAWSKYLLEIFQLDLQVHGADLLHENRYLLASNHISWIDIHVINAFIPIRFVAKSEMAHWPIFGWMARQLGTIFIRRESPSDARRVVAEMARVLQSESICIFPEGTSTNGGLVLPFKHSLFESAVVSRVAIYPLAIQYVSKTTGLRSEIPAFVGDMGLLGSISSMLKSRDLQARITLLEPLSMSLETTPDRKQLAVYCHDAIARAII